MSRLRKMAGALLALTMILMMSLSALAGQIDENPSAGKNADKVKDVHVTLPADETLLAGHTFVAYQIFKGTQEEDTVTEAGVAENRNSGNYLGDAVWGDDFDDTKEDAFLEEIAALKYGESTPFQDCGNAAEGKKALAVTEALRDTCFEINDNVVGAQKEDLTTVQFLDEFARIVFKYLKTGDNVGHVLEPGVNELKSGYYLIVDTTSVQGDAVLNAYLFQVTLDLEVKVKTDKPTLDKTIVDENGNDIGEYSDAAMGDVTRFQLTSAVPDMTHYAAYKYVITDVLSPGLTFDKESVKITIGESKVEKFEVKVFSVSKDKETIQFSDENGTVLDSDTLKAYGLDASELQEYLEPYVGGTYVRIVLKDFYKDYLEKPGAKIVVNYSAALNEKALVGEVGNPNTVRLQYWNNPNLRQNGEPWDDDFKPDDPMGETPWDTTYTFTTALMLTKIDGDARVDQEGYEAGGTPVSASDLLTEKALPGAVFKVTGEALNQALVTGSAFVEYEGKDTDETVDGPYYMLEKDGSFTKTAPTDKTKDLYRLNGNGEAVKYKKVAASGLVSKGEKLSFDVEVGEDGVLKLVGLSSGEYLITEIKAPEGYNILKYPIKVEINCQLPETYEVDGNGQKTEKENTGEENNCTWTATYGDWDPDKNDGEGGYVGFDGEGSLPVQTLTYTDLDSSEEGFIGGFKFEIANNRGSMLPRTGGIGTTLFYIIGCLLVVGAGVLLVVKMRSGRKEEE